MIQCGYQCNNLYCKNRSKCKYRKSFNKLHNFYIRIRNFFKYRLHIKLPWLIYLDKKHTDLSGTTTCPFKMPRNYSCNVCEYQAGYDEHMKGICGNKDYINSTWEESHLDESPYCRFFEKNEWADRYDKKTGETIYNDK